MLALETTAREVPRSDTFTGEDPQQAVDFAWGLKQS